MKFKLINLIILFIVFCNLLTCNKNNETISVKDNCEKIILENLFWSFAEIYNTLDFSHSIIIYIANDESVTCIIKFEKEIEIDNIDELYLILNNIIYDDNYIIYLMIEDDVKYSKIRQVVDTLYKLEIVNFYFVEYYLMELRKKSPIKRTPNN